MNTIFKYQFQIKDTVSIEMPVNAKVLSIQVQNGIPTMWVYVIPNAVVETRTFYIYGTGHRIEANISQHLGTIQMGGLVWHIFE